MSPVAKREWHELSALKDRYRIENTDRVISDLILT